MPGDRYEKGYVVEFPDGKLKVVKKAVHTTYQYAPIPDPDHPGSTKGQQLVEFNQDIIIYTSHKTKYGIIPVSSIKDMYEVKIKRIGNVINVYDSKNKLLFTQE